MKLAVVTCALYIAIALLLEAALEVVVQLTGDVSLYPTRRGFALVFLIVWFAAFNLAWYFVWTRHIAKLAK